MPHLMKLLLIQVCLTCQIAFAPYAFSQSHTLEGKAIGRYHNDLFSTWHDEPITIYVDRNRQFYMSGGEGVLKCTTFFRGEQLPELIAALRKVVRYCDAAKSEGLETLRYITVIKNKSNDSETGLRIEFFSANKGQQTDAILSTVDFKNDLDDIKLHVSREEVLKLLQIIARVPAASQWFIQQQEHADEVLRQK